MKFNLGLAVLAFPYLINAQVTTLDKGYIPSAYANGCVAFNPAVDPANADFMEKDRWVTSRVITPRHCDEVKIANPVFSWPYPTDMVAGSEMTLSIVKVPGGTPEIIKTRDARYLYHKILAAGLYDWSVSYVNKSNLFKESKKRRFMVPRLSLLKIPKGPELRAMARAKGRPRLLPGVNWQSVHNKANANAEYKPSYTALIAEAQRLYDLKIAAVPENKFQANFPSKSEYDSWRNGVYAAADDEVDAIETLAFVGRLTGNGLYIDNAIERLSQLALWPVNGVTGEAYNDQYNRKIFRALALGLDLFQGSLLTKRESIAAAVQSRIINVINKLPGLNLNILDSHLLTSIVYTTEALMYAVGTPEYPNADKHLELAWEAMITTAGAWGGHHDGGFGNGTAYGWYAMTHMVRILAATKLITNINLTQFPAMGGIGYNQIAQTPPNARLRGQFGDEAEFGDHFENFARNDFRLLAALSGNKDYEWYWRTNTFGATPFPLSAYHYLVLSSLPSAPVAPATSHVVKNNFLFEEAGYVAMHSDTKKSDRSSLFFRSSQLGAYGHSHADNNAFTFVSKGKEIFISGGYYPDWKNAHHLLVGRATRYKNALTFGGRIGQAEPAQVPTAPGAPVIHQDANGKLINYLEKGSWTVATGDATKAYRSYGPDAYWFPQMSSVIRTVAYNKVDRIAVIYDYATSDKNTSWELNFQTLNPISYIKTTSNAFTVTNSPARVCTKVSSVPASWNMQESNFAISPGTHPRYTPQTQIRFKSNEATKEFVAITIIDENCRATFPTPVYNGSIATVNVLGKVFTFDKHIVKVP